MCVYARARSLSRSQNLERMQREKEADQRHRAEMLRLKQQDKVAYIRTYIHTYMHACMHTYIHTCIHAYIHACMHTYMHACIHTCIHTYMHACIHTCIHTYIHTYMHTYMHTYIHACMHAYIHTYIHTCMPATYIHICIYIRTYIHICIYIHTYIHACIHTYIHTCIHTYIHTCIHTYIHTYIHAYIHTYTHTYSWRVWSVSRGLKVTSLYILCHIIINTMSHHHTYYVTSSSGVMLGRVALYILCIEVLLHLYMYISVNNNRTWDYIQDGFMPVSFLFCFFSGSFFLIFFLSPWTTSKMVSCRSIFFCFSLFLLLFLFFPLSSYPLGLHPRWFYAGPFLLILYLCC